MAEIGPNVHSLQAEVNKLKQELVTLQQHVKKLHEEHNQYWIAQSDVNKKIPYESLIRRYVMDVMREQKLIE